MAEAALLEIRADVLRVQDAVREQLAVVFGGSRVAQHQLCKEAASSLFRLVERKASLSHSSAIAAEHLGNARGGREAQPSCSDAKAELDLVQADIDQCTRDLEVLGKDSVTQVCHILEALAVNLANMGHHGSTASSSTDSIHSSETEAEYRVTPEHGLDLHPLADRGEEAEVPFDCQTPRRTGRPQYDIQQQQSLGHAEAESREDSPLALPPRTVSTGISQVQLGQALSADNSVVGISAEDNRLGLDPSLCSSEAGMPDSATCRCGAGHVQAFNLSE